MYRLISKILVVFCIAALHLSAQNNYQLTGKIKDAVTHAPVEFVNVVLFSASDSSMLNATATDVKGSFKLAGSARGKVFLKYSSVGYVESGSPVIQFEKGKAQTDLGEIVLTPVALKTTEVTVTSTRSNLESSIDKKVYNFDQDAMSKAGAVSDLLQNVPSVQLDIDGNVSLRGSGKVMIMINGKTSPLLKTNAGENLEQIPASAVDHVEVITNPSAKYKPDGTAGILNIVLKKNTLQDINGNVSVNAGNNSRYNSNILLNMHPGDFSLSAGYSLRKDVRGRINSDNRTIDSLGMMNQYSGSDNQTSRPLSHMVTASVEYSHGSANTFGLSGSYMHMNFDRYQRTIQQFSNPNGVLFSNYERIRTGDEIRPDFTANFFYTHLFDRPEHELKIEYKLDNGTEKQHNQYAGYYHIPQIDQPVLETLNASEGEKTQTVNLDYTNQASEDFRFEAGYEGEFANLFQYFDAEQFDPVVGRFIVDTTVTNSFEVPEYTHAAYGTAQYAAGPFSVLAGVRGEYASVNPHLMSKGIKISSTYTNIYPTLHLGYKLDNLTEVRINYSRRVNRPERDDLNPFSAYQDNRNIRTGNPYLKPEYINSYQAGIQFNFDEVTVIPTLYYQRTQNKITRATKQLNDTTLLSTMDNLSTSDALGLELVVSLELGNTFTSNLSLNGFYNQIDASNIGYSANKSTYTWAGSWNMNMHLWAQTMLQVNANFQARRLTPQGEMNPNYVVNMGLRQDVFDDKLTLTFTVSDLFNTLRRELLVNTPTLIQDQIARRDSHIFYVGASWHFGRPDKKQKEKALKYDNSL